MCSLSINMFSSNKCVLSLHVQIDQIAVTTSRGRTVTFGGQGGQPSALTVMCGHRYFLFQNVLCFILNCLCFMLWWGMLPSLVRVYTHMYACMPLPYLHIYNSSNLHIYYIYTHIFTTYIPTYLLHIPTYLLHIYLHIYNCSNLHIYWTRCDEVDNPPLSIMSLWGTGIRMCV